MKVTYVKVFHSDELTVAEIRDVLAGGIWDGVKHDKCEDVSNFQVMLRKPTKRRKSK